MTTDKSKAGDHPSTPTSTPARTDPTLAGDGSTNTANTADAPTARHTDVTDPDRLAPNRLGDDQTDRDRNAADVERDAAADKLPSREQAVGLDAQLRSGESPVAAGPDADGNWRPR